jgi:signal transduction histidine kinase
MGLSTLFNALTVFILLGLSLSVLLKDHKSRIHQVFTLFLLTLAAWIVIAILADNSSSQEAAILWTRLAIVPPLFACPLFLYFCLIFPKAQRRVSPLHFLFILGLPICLLVFVPTEYNIQSVELQSWGTSFTPGWLYYLLDTLIVTYGGLGLYRLKKTYQLSSGYEERLQIRYFLIAVLLLLLVGITTNSALPLLLGYSKASVYGPSIAILLFAAFTTYAVIRHHLLDIKLLATELIFSGFVLFSFLHVAAAATWNDAIMRGIYWLGINLFGYIFLRQVLRETKQRQKISEQARELERENRYLQELLKQKGNFLQVASHILNTPLSKIRGYVSMIMEDADLTADVRKNLEVVEKSGEELVNLITRFQEIEDIKSGPPILKPKFFEVEPLIEKIIKDLSPLAKKQAVTINKKWSTNISKILGDKKIVGDILATLIDNAIRYNTPKGSVIIRVTQEKHQLKIMVQDTGIGLSEEEKGKVFHSLYFRSVNALKVYPDGAGIALYRARLLANYSDGDILVQSPGFGKGCTFSVILPVAAM